MKNFRSQLNSFKKEIKAGFELDKGDFGKTNNSKVGSRSCTATWSTVEPK